MKIRVIKFDRVPKKGYNPFIMVLHVELTTEPKRCKWIDCMNVTNRRIANSRVNNILRDWNKTARVFPRSRSRLRKKRTILR